MQLLCNVIESLTQLLEICTDLDGPMEMETKTTCSSSSRKREKMLSTSMVFESKPICIVYVVVVVKGPNQTRMSKKLKYIVCTIKKDTNSLFIQG